MPFKSCHVCQNLSYSSAEGRIWICPCCGQDLSQKPAFPRAGKRVRLRPEFPKIAVAGAEPFSSSDTGAESPPPAGKPQLFVLRK